MVERSEKEAIEMEDFPGHVALLKAQNGVKFVEEFESLVIDTPFTQHAASLLCNKVKNRYKNVIPCKFFQSCCL